MNVDDVQSSLSSRTTKTWCQPLVFDFENSLPVFRMFPACISIYPGACACMELPVDLDSIAVPFSFVAFGFCSQFLALVDSSLSRWPYPAAGEFPSD